MIDVNEKDIHGCTPLMEASSRGILSIVKLLKSKGARVNVKDKQFNTALILAAERGHFRIVKFLIDAGAKVDAKDKNGNTAFLLACAKGYEETALYLKEKGAEPKVESCIGISAVDHAYRYRFGEKVDPEPEERLSPKKLKPHKGPLSPRMNGRRPASAAVFSGTAESAATTRRLTTRSKDYLAELLLEKEKSNKVKKVKTKGKAQETKSSEVPNKRSTRRDTSTSNDEERIDYRHYPYFETWQNPTSEEYRVKMDKLISTSKVN